MRNAGFVLPKIGPHTLGMHYVPKGGNVFSLQRIMGRRRLETTMIYANMSTELAAQQYRKFSPMADIEITREW